MIAGQSPGPAASGAVQGDPSVVGSWTPPEKFKPPGARGAYLAIHLSVLPNGKLLAWPHDYDYLLATGHPAKSTPRIMLWDPATNQYSSTDVLWTNLFCSGHAFLPDGRLVILGGNSPAAQIKGYPTATGNHEAFGNKHTVIYDYRTNTWQAGPDMAAGRYYGSALTMGSGEILAVSGYSEQGYDNPLIEIYNPTTGWRTLPGATTGAYPDWYPQIYQLSDGRIFGSVPGDRTFFLDPQGAGRVWGGPTMNYPRRYYGTSVMYDEDKLLVLGGNAAPGRAGSGGNNLITNTAETIDLKSPNPTWQPTGSMRFPRWLANATILPDGTVLVTGGTREQENTSGNALRGAVYPAELWSPDTGQWTVMASLKVPRLYHSTGILLPDGRVLVSGGGQPESSGEGKGTIHDDMQIFSPPYLFRGPRPTIASAPDSAGYGQSIRVTSPDADAITKVNLIRLGSTTHGFNMNQRIVRLPFAHDGGALNVQLPSNPNAAPPGHYMLFLLNSLGVPSTAKIIQLGAS